MRSQHELLLDCAQRLNKSRLTYMVTGSMASNIWGLARLTHDLDIVMQYTTSEVPKVVQAFTPGFFVQEISVRNALRPPYQFNALDESSKMKVDVWLLRPDALDQEMFRRRQQVDYEGEVLSVASPEDVLLSKLRWWKLSGSDHQLQDCAGIAAVQSGKLDLQYLRHWATELGVSDTLEKILSGEIGPKTT